MSYRCAGGHENLASHVTALLFARQRVLKVNGGRARFDHGFDHFEYIQWPTETGFGIGNDWNEPIDFISSFGVIDLIGALECLVDSFHDRGDTVGGIKALVRV